MTSPVLDPKKLLRRTIGITIALLLPSVAAYSLWRGINLSKTVTSSSMAGVALAVIALVIAISNIWGAWISPWLYRRKHAGSSDGYCQNSGAPLFGAFMAVSSFFFAFGDTWAALPALIALLVDPGGPVGFVLITWNDSSFWDKK